MKRGAQERLLPRHESQPRVAAGGETTVVAAQRRMCIWPARGNKKMAAGGAAAAARAMGGSGARGRRVLCSSQTTAVHTRLRPTCRVLARARRPGASITPARRVCVGCGGWWCVVAAGGEDCGGWGRGQAIEILASRSGGVLELPNSCVWSTPRRGYSTILIN